MSVPESLDFSKFFSIETNARQPSPLKTMIHYFQDPNIIFLGGGLPMADYFPWDNLSVDSPQPPFTNGIGEQLTAQSKVSTTVVHKNSANGDVPLARSLQYGFSMGQPELMKFIREHTELIHKPKYSDWDCLATVGNTQGWESTLRIFCNRGETILAESSSFTSSLASAEAQGINVVPIPIDDFGIIPSELDRILNQWVGEKPKLLYTIPTGQNPTGSSLSDERKAEIYKLACKHDFLIIEDEPYYFLQMDKYTRDVESRTKATVQTHEEFVAGLAKSFVSFDTEGRVLRLDSFSKVLAPGTRLGWIVGSKKILMHFLRLHEMTIQSPSGFAQSLVAGTLNRWGQDGYLDWLMGLRHEYTVKRDVAIDALYKYCPLDIVKINPPIAGMFFTVSLDAAQHPKFASEYNSDPAKIETRIYELCISHGVLIVPGSWFKTNGESIPPQPESSKSNSHPTNIFFRGTYAAVPLDKLEEGLKRVGEALAEEFKQ